MEDFGDEMEWQFVEIIQNVLGFGGAQEHFSDKQKKMVFSSFYMYHCMKKS